MSDSHHQGDTPLSSKQLPEQPSLEHLREQAKDLLTAFRKGDDAAAGRFRNSLPALAKFSAEQVKLKPLALHDAQSAVAIEYGFASWAKLVRHVEDIRAREGTTPEVEALFIKRALSNQTSAIRRMLDLYPPLPRFSLVTALLCGELSVISEWITANPEAVSEPVGARDWKPLEYVCFSRVHQAVPERYPALEAAARVLLDAGADVNTAHLDESNPEGPLSVLYGAADEANHPGIARLLLERGANPNDGESVYHAAQHNRPEILQALLDHGADISSVSGQWGNTPLYFLAGHRPSDSGNATVVQGVKWLLEHGADPNVPCIETNETPLQVACRTGNTELVRLFLDHGANPQHKRNDGYTGFDLAMETGHRAAVALLVGKGGNHPLAPDVEFFSACAFGELDKARFILRDHPEFARQDHKAGWVLTKLAELGVVEGVRTMLTLGFSPALVGESNATPLHFSCYCGWAETVSVLLEVHAPLEALDETYDCRPLCWALEGMIWNPNPKGDYVRIVKEMLAAGAPVEDLRNRIECDDMETEAMRELVRALGDDWRLKIGGWS